jgi:hypothetical protein
MARMASYEQVYQIHTLPVLKALGLDTASLDDGFRIMGQGPDHVVIQWTQVSDGGDRGVIKRRMVSKVTIETVER